ncbi:proline racemase family protein [Natronocalculus amylovorans]|uniref:Proline racemase family protein n=1 Tax=Natronocalculus amylovorans TaxID=2917812 RepID=A0AAE3FX65_9EURY|nr:proline racemase family protein [Natronocalculus amylovorans]MCL9816901.1 proline racemase family protein [Natronocalculus amylovorans]NUE03038.1 proline racemase family protein [Halorubraceae archaeon YAN]
MTPIDISPPAGWTQIQTIDAHTGGEPLRIVTDGLPPIEGETILEKRQYMQRELDRYRQALMYEPRGHADMYGAILVEPTVDDADIGVLFTHNEGYSTMCGHGIIALGAILAESNLVENKAEELRIETPAGIVTAQPIDDGDRVSRVAFTNVPSFVYARDRTVTVPGIGELQYDIAFGGAFYAYCQATDAGVGLTGADAASLIDVGRKIKAAVAADCEIIHPYEGDLSFLYGVIFTGPANGAADSRNICVFADGEIDRCPTGTGVSGRLALGHEDETIAPTEPFTVESIVGSTFTGSYTETTYGGYDAVIPTIEGSAYITGVHTFVLDPTDPFKNGFLL